jgi:hypothetical protein
MKHKITGGKGELALKLEHGYDLYVWNQSFSPFVEKPRIELQDERPIKRFGRFNIGYLLDNEKVEISVPIVCCRYRNG